MGERSPGRLRAPGQLALAILLAGLAGPSGTVAAAEDEVARGQELAETLCGDCHALGLSGPSPLAQAPPFRDLKQRYPVESLAESLAEGIVTGHPAMPAYEFRPDEIDALLAYLKSL